MQLYKRLLLLVLPVATACGGSDGVTGPVTEPPAGTPVTLEVTLQRDSVVLDPWADTARVVAVVRDQNGATPSGVTLAWESLEPSVATVSSSGVVKSVGLGSATVRLTASRTGSDQVQKDVRVRVVAQKNSFCVAPSPAARGAASASIAFGSAEVMTSLASPTHDGYRTLAGDFDGDGDTDFVRLEYSYPSSSSYTGRVVVFRNTSGTLSDATDEVLASAIVPDHPRDFEVRDFTGDGVVDFYIAQHGFDASPFPGAPNLFLTRSGNQLVETFASRFAPAPTGGFSHGSSSADVDCDGDLDLVELNLTGAYPSQLWLNGGTGQFTPASPAAFPIASASADQRWQEPAFIDFDNDGDPDLYLGARSGPGWNEDVLLVNDGFGNFRQREGIQLPSPAFSPNHGVNNARASDFNGDGLLDLLFFEIPQPFSTSSAIRLWLNDGEGGFDDAGAAWGLPATCTGEVIEPLHVADVNGDGWPDVVVPPGCPNLGGTGVLLNAGSGFVFRPFSAIEPWLGEDIATPADIDGDGRLDLFFGDRGGNPVLVRIL